ncbi:MAG: hypothetical protein IJ690_04470 [Clostridia bacterium]|nr:hypothetical protein [Clostridia bacterium]
MSLHHFKFKDIDSLVTAKQGLSKMYPDICIYAIHDSMQLAVEALNSCIFDTRITAILQEFGGELID